MILCYMDEVFKHFIMELPEEVDGDTACKMFESYWKIEYWVGHHEPIHVWNYYHSNDQNIDCSDVKEIGMSFLHSTI